MPMENSTRPPQGGLCANVSYVTLITGAHYAAPAACLPVQLQRVNAACRLILVYDDEDATLPMPMLEAAYGKEQLVRLSSLKARYRRNRQDLGAAVGSGRRLLTRVESTNTHQKLWLWALPVNKAVFLDIDILLLGNVDSLLSIEPMSFKTSKKAIPRPSLAAASCSKKNLYFNSGVFVFRPSLAMLSVLLRVARFTGYPFNGHLPHEAESWPDICSPVDDPNAFLRMFPNESSYHHALRKCKGRHGGGFSRTSFIQPACEPKYGDQSILNAIFARSRKRLPHVYNDFNGMNVSSSRIIHFVNEPKPWDYGLQSGRVRKHDYRFNMNPGRKNATRLWAERCPAAVRAWQAQGQGGRTAKRPTSP